MTHSDEKTTEIGENNAYPQFASSPELAHDARMRPIISAAMVIALACSLLALAYGVARLLHRFGPAANTAANVAFGAAGVAILAGLFGIPVVIVGPARIGPWQVVLYFASLFVLAVLTSAVLVPLFFGRRQS